MSKYLPSIMSYIISVELHTWHVCVTIYVALNSVRHKSIFSISVVLNCPAYVCHVVVVGFLGSSVDIRLLFTVVEIILLSNIVWKLLNFTFSLHLFLQI